MNIIKTLGDMADSKKATALGLCLAAITGIATAGLAVPVTIAAIVAFAFLGGAYMIGQGMADTGKEAAKVDSGK